MLLGIISLMVCAILAWITLDTLSGFDASASVFGYYKKHPKIGVEIGEQIHQFQTPVDTDFVHYKRRR